MRWALVLCSLLIGLTTSVRSVQAQSTSPTQPDYADFMRTGPLGDIPLGAESAWATVFDYSNFTCHDCVTFYTKVFPSLKSQYVATGKIRWIVRELVWRMEPLFPGDTSPSMYVFDAAPFMVARCFGSGKYHAAVETFYQRANEWLKSEPLPAITAIAAGLGMGQAALVSCLNDRKLQSEIEFEGNRANRFRPANIPMFFFADDKKRSVTRLLPQAADNLNLKAWQKELAHRLGN